MPRIDQAAQVRQFLVAKQAISKDMQTRQAGKMAKRCSCRTPPGRAEPHTQPSEAREDPEMRERRSAAFLARADAEAGERRRALGNHRPDRVAQLHAGEVCTLVRSRWRSPPRRTRCSTALAP